MKFTLETQTINFNSIHLFLSLSSDFIFISTVVKSPYDSTTDDERRSKTTKLALELLHMFEGFTY